MNIKEVEELSGLTRANIRFYEKEGLCVPRRNPINDYREYSPEDVQTLKKIVFLRKLDVSLEDIRSLQKGMVSMCTLMKSQGESLEGRIGELENARSICREIARDAQADYEKLDVEKYEQREWVQEGNMKKDTLGYLASIKDKVLLWGMFFAQLVIAVSIYFLLPDRIPINWDESYATSYVSREWIFLYPVFSLAAMTLLRSLIRAVIAKNMMWASPRLLDRLTAVVLVCFSLILLTCEFYTILFVRGVRWNVDRILLTEMTVCTLVTLGYGMLEKYRFRNQQKDL